MDGCTPNLDSLEILRLSWLPVNSKIRLKIKSLPCLQYFLVCNSMVNCPSWSEIKLLCLTLLSEDSINTVGAVLFATYSGGQEKVTLKSIYQCGRSSCPRFYAWRGNLQVWLRSALLCPQYFLHYISPWKKFWHLRASKSITKSLVARNQTDPRFMPDQAKCTFCFRPLRHN